MGENAISLRKWSGGRLLRSCASLKGTLDVTFPLSRVRLHVHKSFITGGE